MKLHKFLLNRKVKICAIFVFILLLTDIILNLFFLDNDPFLTILSGIDNSFLLLAEKFANNLLNWTGSAVRIKDHNSFLNSEIIQGFSPMTIYKKWVIPLIVFFWLTKTSIREKLQSTFFLIVIYFILNSIDLAFKAHYFSLGLQNGPQTSLSVTLGTMVMAAILFLWYWRYRESLIESLNKININTEILENKFVPIVVIVFTAIILVNFVMNYFDFRIWINILFTISRKVLAIFGYEAKVEPFLLTGEYGNISMARSCLGYNTMFLFASVVYLTGKNSKNSVIYIFIGLLILNLANVIRFVLLFIHLQKHGDYILATDMHNLYNYSIYVLVLVLWVIWFKKNSDSVPTGKIKQIVS